ncbi:peptidase domain-containing ABC transporter [Leptolyngbya ohadii]|uniref:peptidase domain-containing ABC transporter n=1 Tax=Leptolyngbya ohadii TaxID=1962290 RepID=UPI000B59E1D1|nr:peptidase domain-containing ABC transporter [Leptolyngbya ohadii]
MKYALVLQHTQEDCGAACLASIAKHYGRNFSLNRAREAVGTGQLGTTLLGLRRGTTALGFHARSAVASPELIDRINEIPLPAILHWQGKHWVLLYGKRRNSYIIADPAIGIRYLSEAELLEGWSDRVILLVQPDSSRFYDQDEDRSPGIGQFFQRVMPYWVVLLEAIVCVTLIGLLSLVSPLFIQILTDEVLIQGDTQLLLGIVVGVIVLYLVRSGLSLVADILIANFAQRLELGLVLEFGRQILQLPLTYYETRRSGEVISRLRDIEEINRLVAQVIVSLPSSILIAIASLGLMLFYSWKLALLSGVMAIVMLLSTIGLKPILQQKTQRAMVLETENQGVLVEAFKGALTLKSTAAAPQFWDELQSRFGRLAHLLYGTTKIAIYNNTFSNLVADIGNTLLLGLGGWLVIQQELSIGQLLAFTALNRNVTGLMDELVNLIDDWIRVKTANARLQEVVMTPPETQNDDRKAWVNLPDNAAIFCQNVHFHYPGRVELLKDFSLEMSGGQAIALIGKSGCGKSTLAKLIAGLYFPQSGNVRLANYNLQDLALDCVRQQVVLVPQEAHFWSRSILENFRMGNPHLSFEQIVQACQMTGADDFISRMPEKYQTILGEFGATLSGGQRQRLAIARAIVNDPPLLILDESTAGLDPVSEAQLLDKLLWHRRGKTTILISHRPQVITQAEWVVFLDQGQFIRQGSLSDLQNTIGDHLDFLT